jgi:subtilisin family serine protease
MQNWEARGRFVYERLKAVALRSQAAIRAQLHGQGVTHQSFWIVNAIKVTSNKATLQQLAARPEVEQIVAERTYQLPEPLPGEPQPRVQMVEWNIDRINAPQVWSTFGDRGEDIVIANIDTGVQFDHPALVAQYRGNQGGGSFDHNYNWFDPSQICGSPSLTPCDNVGHGSHTMGTMVGDDGGENQIGVAPGARWIAAKGCEYDWCSDTALLAAGQWVLAPTDLDGQNPRPDLRPHIVNNSWGGGGNNPWYQGIVDAWIASGIFPAFSNGNFGSGCYSSGSPGDYVQSYSAGAFDINNGIAGFSSRGPSYFGVEIKPNLAAPGVDVKSSVPYNGYAWGSGTSMASPHVAGTVALMWSAAPSIIGDIVATRALLDQTAIDTSDLSCGGSDADNNVYGEGRLDAYAAVEQAPRGPSGTLQGTVVTVVSDPFTSPLYGALVQAVGPTNRTTQTDVEGQYAFPYLPVGAYDVIVSLFGYLTQTASGVTVSEGAVTVQDFTLELAPAHMVSGYVRDNNGDPVANATVSILGTPISPATTDGNGFYSFASVPEGEYDVQAAAAGCNDPQTLPLVVGAADVTLDFTLPQRTDAFGYFCQHTAFAYIEASNPLPLSGDDTAVQVDLPFPFAFYGQTYNTAFVSTNGFLNFLQLNTHLGGPPIPNPDPPNAAIYAFWDDLYVYDDSTVNTELLGQAPDRRFVIEWRNVHFCCVSEETLDIEVVLYENGRILMQYRNIGPNGREQGNSAAVGIENESGTIGLQYSYDEPVISNELAVLYRLPPSGFIEGTVTDANDGLPVGATVRALQDGSQIRAVTTNADGFYRMQVPIGTYDVEAAAAKYETQSASITVEVDQTVAQNFALRTARAVVSPAALEFLVPVGQSRTKTLTLGNTGSLDMDWEVLETGGNRVATSSTFGLKRNPDYDPSARTTQGLYVGGTPSGWSPTSPGDILRSWVPAGVSLPWGVGYTGNLWLSDPPTLNNHEFTVEGAATGRMWYAGWAGAWPGDMAYDADRGLMCQVNVGGDNGIYCWDPNTGTVVDSITGSFPWTNVSQRGLAYRPGDDTFYIGGWNEGILYHIKGLSYPDKGAVVGQCNPPDGTISGLAWNPAFNIVWAATNSPSDTIYELNPDNCNVLATLPHPNPWFNGAGLEMDEAGNLWMISQGARTVYLVESGVPAFVDVPWLLENPSSGTLAPGGSQSIAVTVDTTGLQPGVYNATLFIRSNSARQPTLRVPVSVLVPAYWQGVNAGGKVYTDRAGDTWAADKQYASGSWGYVNRSTTLSTKKAIAGTEDDKLYQDLRSGALEYRFDGLPAGIYQLELDFAELKPTQPGLHMFDVLIEGNMTLYKHDIALEAGNLVADNHTFFLPVTDGQLNIRLIPYRGYGDTIINALRVTHRPDR